MDKMQEPTDAIKTKIADFRKELEGKSREELIEVAIELAVACCAVTTISFNLGRVVEKDPTNPYPDWSKAMFEGAAQCNDIANEIKSAGILTPSTVPPKHVLKVINEDENEY